MAVYVALLLALVSTCVCEPRGHLQNFGLHKEPTKVLPEITVVPQPQEFYHKYVVPRQPVVFRGAAFHSKASQLWTTEYLEREYGDMVVRLEARFEGDATMPASAIGVGRDTMRHFIRNFDTTNGYVISQIPIPMEKDVAIPPCLRCGHFAKGIQEVHLFITARGGKTLIHRDPFANIHCVFNGTKDWITVENKYHDYLYQSDSSNREFGGFSTVDVDQVDLYEHPNIAKVEFARVTLNGGDCIYMPGSYWHQVRVNGEYNTAVSIWFTRSIKAIPRDWSDCQSKFDFTPMSDVDVLWRFSGGNDSIPQGSMDVHVLRVVLLTYNDENDIIDIDEFCKKMIGSSGEHTNYDAATKRIEFREAILNGSSHLTGTKVKSWSTTQLKDLLRILDPIDVTNTEGYEYSYIEAESLKSAVKTLLSESKVGFKPAAFLSMYTSELGGTAAVASEILSNLNPASNDIITHKMVKQNLKKVLTKFRSAPQHDPENERLWHDHLRKRDEL